MEFLILITVCIMLIFSLAFFSLDLIPRENAEAWLKYLKNEFPVIPFKTSLQKQKSNLVIYTYNLFCLSSCLRLIPLFEIPVVY